MRHETVLFFQTFYDQDVLFCCIRYDRANKSQVGGCLHKHDPSPAVEIVQISFLRNFLESIDNPFAGSAFDSAEPDWAASERIHSLNSISVSEFLSEASSCQNSTGIWESPDVLFFFAFWIALLISASVGTQFSFLTGRWRSSSMTIPSTPYRML